MKFELSKDTEKAKFILSKRNLPAITAEVVVDLDVSGSTETLYRRGTIQEAVQRILPVALNFDDNGDVPVYVFNAGANYQLLAKPLQSSNYSDYISENILHDRNVPKWGGTDYSPVLERNLTDLGFIRISEVKPTTPKGGFLNRIFAKIDPVQSYHGPELHADSATGLPSIIYFITDGECDGRDELQTRALLEKCAKLKANVYFNFIGVGTGSSFDFLKSIADDYPNAGFANIQDLTQVADSDDLYEYLLPTELTDWLRSFVKTAGA